mmetsp:Transcript_64194/g.134944  ORF Transcript_64194/g.134944 Transcript_64194/m.134944 type:complete len:237 (+) Transcript_64194:138-848(+)
MDMSTISSKVETAAVDALFAASSSLLRAGCAGLAAATPGGHEARGLAVLYVALHARDLSSVCPLLVLLHLLLLLHLLEGRFSGGLGGGLHNESGNALDDAEEDATNDGVSARRLPAAARREDAAGEEPRGDGVPVVVLPPNVLKGAVERGEGTTPDGEISSQDGGPGSGAIQSACPPVSGGGVSGSLNEVPNEASDGSHSESTAQVIDNAVRARLTSGIAVTSLGHGAHGGSRTTK